MDDPILWGGIWFAVAVLLAGGEIASPGTFFLAPFALGAAVAGIASFFGLPVIITFVIFFITSVVAFVAMRPLARKLDLDFPNPTGIGANRLIDHSGVVSTTIPAGGSGTGMVKLGGEEWRAQGRDGMGVPTGTDIRVIAVEGTRVVVEPANDTGLDALG